MGKAGDAGGERNGDPSGSPRRSRLYLSGFVLVGFAVPAALVWFFVGHSEPIRQEALLALCAGIAASAAWWAVFSRYAESEAKRLLTFELAEQHRVLDGRLSGLVREVQKESREAHQRNSPRDVYPSHDLHDLRLNRDLTHDLERSQFYYFAGPSGVWVAARVELRSKEAGVPLADVRVRMVDPSSSFAIEKAVRDRERRSENAGRSAEEIRAAVRNDLVLAHVALWCARTSVQGSICLSYESRAMHERLELLDSAIYLSKIDSKDEARYPLTTAWRPGYHAWGAAFEDFDDVDFADFAINRETSRDTVERHLVEKLGLELSDWSEWAERYDQEYLSPMKEVLARARTHTDFFDPSQALGSFR